MTENKTELLPCPFCGGEPTFDYGPQDRWIKVFCSNRSCISTAQFSGEQDAYKAWNTRATVTQSEIGITITEQNQTITQSDRCKACNGNDGDVPCAYPSSNVKGCLRDVRLNKTPSRSLHPNELTDEEYKSLEKSEMPDENTALKIFNNQVDSYTGKVLSGYLDSVVFDTDEVETIRAILQQPSNVNETRNGSDGDDGELVKAAEALIKRWDGPKWKDLPATAQFVNRLRNQVAKHKAQQ